MSQPQPSRPSRTSGWERDALKIILVISVLTITVYPAIGVKNSMDGQAYRERSRLVGDVAEVMKGDRLAERREDHDVIRMNVAWICITLSVIGLGLLRPPKAA